MNEIQIKNLFNEFDINNLSPDDYNILLSLRNDGYIEGVKTEHAGGKKLMWIRLHNTERIYFNKY